MTTQNDRVMRLSHLLAMATMGEKTYKPDTPEHYKRDHEELWDMELARRSMSIFAAWNDLTETYARRKPKTFKTR